MILDRFRRPRNLRDASASRSARIVRLGRCHDSARGTLELGSHSGRLVQRVVPCHCDFINRQRRQRGLDKISCRHPVANWTYVDCSMAHRHCTERNHGRIRLGRDLPVWRRKCEKCLTLFTATVPGQDRCSRCRRNRRAHRARSEQRKARAEQPTTFVAIDGEGLQGRCEWRGCPCERFERDPDDDNICTCGHPRFSRSVSNTERRRSRIAAALEIAELAETRLEIIDCGRRAMKAPPPLERIPKRFGGGFRSPGAADYDWFHRLAVAEQNRLRDGWFSTASTAQTPDEIVGKIAIDEWLHLTRLIDAAGALARGRRLSAARYGGVDPVSALVDDPYAITAGHRHTYVLLGCGDRQLENPDGLSHREIFPFLYEQFRSRPDAAYVGFFLSYDFTQWLKSLPDNKAWLLLTDAGRRKRTMRRARDKRTGQSRPYIAPVRVDEHLVGEGKAWEMNWLEGRRLSIRPMVCDCDYRASTKCEHSKPAWMHICDSGPFFQMSFLSVIHPDEYADDRAGPVCTDEEYALVEEGKANRPDAALDDDMRRYNRLENELLARVMGRLDQGFSSIGIRLRKSQWYGPGAAAAEWLKNVNAPRRETTETVTPRAVLDATTAAYTGGWFEIFMHGPIPGVTYEYDINSAYPDAISRLPCLLHGRWRHDRRRTLPHLESGQLRLVHAVPGGIVGRDPHIGAVLHRQADDSIIRPQLSGGWFWQHEITAAMAAGLVEEVRIDQAWTYDPCDCPPPLGTIANLFEHRLRVGKKSPAGKAAKLVMNSVYGKFAQGAGSRPFGNFIYAGLITADTRAAICRAIATHPRRSRGVVMCATDAIFFVSPHPTLPLSTEKLGYWSAEEHRDLCCFKPGAYWHEEAREAYRLEGKPIFKARGVNAKAFAKQMDRVDTDFADLVDRALTTGRLDDVAWPRVSYTSDFSLVTAKLALHRHQWSLAGTVCEVDQVQSADPERKRHSPYFDRDLRVIRTRPYQHADSLESRPYIRGSVRAELAAIRGETQPERFDEYESPDGPLTSILFGQLGTGQWA